MPPLFVSRRNGFACRAEIRRRAKNGSAGAAHLFPGPGELLHDPQRFAAVPGHKPRQLPLPDSARAVPCWFRRLAEILSEKVRDGEGAIASTPGACAPPIIINDSYATITDLSGGAAIKVTVSGRNSQGSENAETSPANATVPQANGRNYSMPSNLRDRGGNNYAGLD
jgi:hypothetical protein